MRLGFGFDSPGSSKNGNSGTPGGKSPASCRSVVESFTYADLPPVGPNEIEFFVEAPTKKKAREQVRSQKKTVGAFTFDVLVFPGGNSTSYTLNPKVAVYVECVDVEKKDPRWVFNGVRFSVSIVNVKDYRKTLYHEDTHTFSALAVDRGWPELISHAELSADAGWLDEQGRMCIRAWACNRQADTIVMNSDYDTRAETGFIGLKNHGATCYLNGLLQSYFHLGKFREIVYQMHDVVKNGGEMSPSGGTRMSLPLALQSVFLRLEKANTPVNCTELIRAFGWDSMDAFTQHDVQELARILCDRLEDKLKEMNGPTGHLPLQTLLEGKIENFIECIDIELKSTKVEAFYDIPVNVRGQANQPLHSLEASLADFTTPELLEGDNAYEAEGFGKQNARKGIRFVAFPPVVSFQLKRFSFDFERMDNVKLHDKFEFPTKIDLGRKKYLLHTILVHSGDVNSGHYYAFVRDYKTNGWLRFDDDQVSRCSEFAAVQDNFGGEDVFPYNYFDNQRCVGRPRIHSAYMLVYVCEAELDSVLCSPKLEEAQNRVFAETKRIDERKRIQEQAKEILKVTLGPRSFTLRRDATVNELAQQVCSDDETAAHTALFHWVPIPNAPVWHSGGSWSLIPRKLVSSGNTTPKSARLDASSLFPPIEGAARTLAEFSEDSIEVLAVHSDSEYLAEWTEATPVCLIVLRYFDPASKTLSELGVHWAAAHTRISALVKIVRERLPSQQEMIVFEETPGGGVALCDLDSRVLNGTLIFQPNVIMEADTDDDDDENAFPIRTMADYVRSLECAMRCTLWVHEANEPLQTDGLLANGEEACGECGTQLVIEGDTRWSVKSFLSHTRVAMNKAHIEVDEAKFRLDFFNHVPSLARDAPLFQHYAGPIGTVLHNKVCTLHAVAVPRGCVSVRFFDEHVREVASVWVPEGEYAIAELAERASQTSRQWQVVKVRKSKICDISKERVRLEATTNAVFEYVRLDPAENETTCWVSHIDRNSGISFGYPFTIRIPPNATVKTAKQLIQEKLGVNERWRVCVQSSDGHLAHLKDEETLVKHEQDRFRIVLEQTHPNPVLIGGHKMHAQKPLTIR